jgi:hypothetical protein
MLCCFVQCKLRQNHAERAKIRPPNLFPALVEQCKVKRRKIASLKLTICILNDFSRSRVPHQPQEQNYAEALASTTVCVLVALYSWLQSSVTINRREELPAELLTRPGQRMNDLEVMQMVKKLGRFLFCGLVL